VATSGRVIHKGKAYYSVGEAARMFGTTATKVRGMMGRGDVEWTQLRVNGRLLIPAESIVAYKRRAMGPPVNLP